MSWSRRKEEAVYYIKKISIAAEVVLIATCLLMFGLTYPITYFGGMEPESAKLCIFMVTCITIVKPIVWIMAFIPPYGFRAAGDVKFTMTTSMLCMWLCRVVLAMVLARVFIWDRSQYGSECLQTGRSVGLFIQYDLKIENGLLIR